MRARSFLRFDTSPIEGSNVVSADLRLWNWHSWSCNARQVEVRRLTQGFGPDTLWSNQPSQGAVAGTASFAHGYSSHCPSKACTPGETRACPPAWSQMLRITWLKPSPIIVRQGPGS